jgi:hypothetical protein
LPNTTCCDGEWWNRKVPNANQPRSQYAFCFAEPSDPLRLGWTGRRSRRSFRARARRRWWDVGWASSSANSGRLSDTAYGYAGARRFGRARGALLDHGSCTRRRDIARSPIVVELISSACQSAALSARRWPSIFGAVLHHWCCRIPLRPLRPITRQCGPSVRRLSKRPIPRHRSRRL